MVQRSLFWDYAGGGDARAYTQEHLHDWLFRSILNGTGNRGVLFKRWESLFVSGTSSPVNVATGAAIVYGTYFESDTAVAVSVSTPTAGDRTDLIVVRRSWADQTCRITRISGIAGGAAASMTQSAGVTWDIPLAQVDVDTAGTITVTDLREPCEYATDLPDGAIDDEDYFTAGTITASKIPNRTRWELKGAGQIDAETTGLYVAEWVSAGGIYGAAYDHWRVASDVTDSLWAWFVMPSNMEAGGTLNFYMWTVPDVNGLGASPEYVEWEIDFYYGYNDVPVEETVALSIDHRSRLEDNIYCDAIMLALEANGIIAVRLTRAGASLYDVYTAPVRLIAVEMEWTASS